MLTKALPIVLSVYCVLISIEASKLYTFTSVSHGLLSGPVSLIDPYRSISIKNLQFDGLAPDAHFFVGTGDAVKFDGQVLRIPDENNSTEKLTKYNGRNIVLAVPRDVPFEWISIRCEANDEYIGHAFVSLANNTFTSVSHNLSSDDVTFAAPNRISIASLQFDGLAPDAHFFVGTGDPQRFNGDLHRIPDENNSSSKLTRYDDRNVVLTVSEDVAFEWVAIWCEANEEYIGHAWVSNILKPKHIPLGFFNKTAVTSGPILLLDQHTVLITNLKFEQSSCPNALFQIIMRDFSNETIISESLQDHDFIDLELNLPKLPKTLNAYSSLQLICVYTNKVLDDVAIPDDLRQLPLYQDKVGPDSYTMRVPKCCPYGNMVATSGCVKSDMEPNFETQVNHSNATHVFTMPIPNVDIDYYDSGPICPYGKYYLFPDDSENMTMTTSGYLLLRSEANPLKRDEYCIDVVTTETGDVATTVFLCFPEEEPQFVNTLYYICVYISAACLFITCLIYSLLTYNAKSFQNVRGIQAIILTLFTASMSIGFLILATTQYLRPEDTICNVLGYGFQLCLISSFTWLAILTRETFWIIKCESNAVTTAKTRIYHYFAYGVGIPVAIMLISYMIDSLVLHPEPKIKETGLSYCWFRSFGMVFYFYLPILVEIVISILYWWKTRTLVREHPTVNHSLHRQLYRSNFTILLVMSVCWVLEVGTYFCSMSMATVVISVFEGLQGVFVFLTYVLQGPGSQQIKAELQDLWDKLFKRQSNGEEREMERLRKNNTAY